MSKNHNIVIYHKSCSDGFASAYIASKYLGNSAEYVPMSYYDRVPYYKNKNILVCDFSFDGKDVKRLLKNKNKVYIIDHHKTAVEKLKNIDDKHKHLDMEHSGAYLTWKYFYPDKPVPEFIKYVEDYDLWKFEFEETKPFSLALSLLPMKFEKWAQLEKVDYLKNLINKGKIVEIYQNKNVNISVKSYRMIEHTIDDKNYKVAYKNTSIHVNEIANHLVKNTSCDFAVCYCYNDRRDETRFNLRSNDSKVDVSEIAKLLGGGGHRNASGMTRKGFCNTIV